MTTQTKETCYECGCELTTEEEINDTRCEYCQEKYESTDECDNCGDEISTSEELHCRMCHDCMSDQDDDEEWED